jgi:hypothetical protein
MRPTPLPGRDLLQVDHLGRLRDLTGGVPCEGSADEVRAVEGLVDLADGQNVEATDYVDGLVDVAFSIKKAHRCQCYRCHECRMALEDTHDAAGGHIP